jgi:hypothetical protein
MPRSPTPPSAVCPARAGVAGAITSTARQVGSAIGIAIAGGLITGVTAPDLAVATHPGWLIVTACGTVPPSPSGCTSSPSCDPTTDGYAMTHRNAPPSIERCRRLVDGCQTRPTAHVAAEIGISRACASKWVNRHRALGALGLHDRSSVPDGQPPAAPIDVVVTIDSFRRSRNGQPPGSRSN